MELSKQFKIVPQTPKYLEIWREKRRKSSTTTIDVLFLNILVNNENVKPQPSIFSCIRDDNVSDGHL